MNETDESGSSESIESMECDLGSDNDNQEASEKSQDEHNANDSGSDLDEGDASLDENDENEDTLEMDADGYFIGNAYSFKLHSQKLYCIIYFQFTKNSTVIVEIL